MKELKKETLCKRCIGCNRLEDENFEGVYRCINFIEWKKEKNNTIISQKYCKQNPIMI